MFLDILNGLHYFVELFMLGFPGSFRQFLDFLSQFFLSFPLFLSLALSLSKPIINITDLCAPGGSPPLGKGHTQY